MGAGWVVGRDWDAERDIHVFSLAGGKVDPRGVIDGRARNVEDLVVSFPFFSSNIVLLNAWLAFDSGTDRHQTAREAARVYEQRPNPNAFGPIVVHVS